MGGDMDLARWRDAAVILLVIESFVLKLVPLALYYLGLRGVIKLQQKLRPILTQAQGYARQADRSIERGSLQIARPFIWLNSRATGIRRAWNSYHEGRRV